jgi:putative transposase
MADRPWEMTAVVLLPDHLHLIWRLPCGDVDYSTRVSLLKKRFTLAYLAAGGDEAAVPTGQCRHRLRGVWQRRFWEHVIRTAKDFRMHLDYIHLSPVKHGLAARPSEWPWSSFHRYVRRGWYEPGWCGRRDLPGNVEYLWPE